MRVMKVLADQWSYGYRPRLFEVDFAPVVRELQAKIQPRYWQVVLKRLMFRAGEHLARYLRAPGIVTGEAVGQVSSQTLQNLAVIACDTHLAALRPLLGSAGRGGQTRKRSR
jgi:thiamine biosynthesis protein ThiI